MLGLSYLFHDIFVLDHDFQKQIYIYWRSNYYLKAIICYVISGFSPNRHFESSFLLAKVATYILLAPKFKQILGF